MANPHDEIREMGLRSAAASLSRVEAAYLEAWRCGVHVTHDSIKRIIAAADACEAERASCDCCGEVVFGDEQKSVARVWAHRLDGYCYECATSRCDAYPDECPHRRRAVSSEDVHREAAE